MQSRAPLAPLGGPGQLQPFGPEVDIISNPSEEDEAGAYSHSAMARLDARHSALAVAEQDRRATGGLEASQPSPPVLDPRAPAFVFGRSTPAVSYPLRHGPPPEPLGSPLRLASGAVAQRPLARSSVATALNPSAPTFLSALNGAQQAFDRPLPSLPMSNLSTKRPFNVAAPEFQPRARQGDGHQAADIGASFRFVPPPGLLTLPLPSPSAIGRSPGGRPLPTPPSPVRHHHHRHESDAEPIKRSRVHEPRSDALAQAGPLSLSRSPPKSASGPNGRPIDRMRSFRMPVGPVSISPERRREQDTLPFAFDTSSVKRVAVEGAAGSDAVVAESGRSDTVGPIIKQRPPIPIFGSPPKTTSAVLVAPVTPARPLPAIPASTPSHDARRSLAGSVITDDDDELSLASVRRRLKSGPPSSYKISQRSASSSIDPQAEPSAQLDGLVRRIQAVIDDKLNSLRLSGTKGGIVHLASLHLDAERSLLGRLAAMLEERDAVNGLADSADAVLDAVEEGYRVVCERLEGECSRPCQQLRGVRLTRLCPCYRQARSSRTWRRSARPARSGRR
jgi:hypothetical protein